MRMEIQMPAEGVLHCHNQHASPILNLGPFLDRGSPECRQVVEQMPVLPKDGPENVRHGKDDARIGNVREGRPLLTLPQLSGPVSTTWANRRLAGMVDEFFLGL